MRLLLSIHNNIALRNWYNSGMMNELNSHYSSITVLTTNHAIAEYLETKSFDCRLIKLNSRILKVCNYYSNAKYSSTSSTSLLKNENWSTLKYSFAAILTRLVLLFTKSENADTIILTTMFGGGEYLSLKLSRATKVFGSLNSWDNPSSRSLIAAQYTRVFVWSDYCQLAFLKWSSTKSEKVLKIGRFQDKISSKELPEEYFRNLVGAKDKKILSFVQGGSSYSQVQAQYNALRRFADSNDYFFIFRAYADLQYDFIVKGDANSWLSIPSATNIGANGYSGGSFDQIDFNIYNSILKYSEIIFTNGSTVLLDCLIYGKRAYTSLDYFDGDDYISFSYFHLSKLYWDKGFKSVDLDKLHFDRDDCQDLQELANFYLGINIKLSIKEIAQVIRDSK